MHHVTWYRMVPRLQVALESHELVHYLVGYTIHPTIQPFFSGNWRLSSAVFKSPWKSLHGNRGSITIFDIFISTTNPRIQPLCSGNLTLSWGPLPVPYGNFTLAIEHCPENTIVDVPIQNGGFPLVKLLAYQKGNHKYGISEAWQPPYAPWCWNISPKCAWTKSPSFVDKYASTMKHVGPLSLYSFI